MSRKMTVRYGTAAIMLLSIVFFVFGTKPNIYWRGVMLAFTSIAVIFLAFYEEREERQRNNRN